MIKLITLFIFAFLFTGCISLTQNIPAQNIYTLNINEEINEQKINASIEILEPQAMQSINTKNLIYTKDNLQEFYALSIWSDKPSKMIQNTMIEALSSSFSLIKPSYIRLKTKYTLQSYLFDFKQEIKNSKSITKFRINIYLNNNQNNKVFFKQFVYKKVNQSISAKLAVNDLNNLNQLFIKDLNTWLKEQIEDLY